MSQLQLSELWRFPVKSMRGARAQQFMLDARGLQGDRAWMLVDSEGHFLTQRQLPRMTLIKAETLDAGVRLQIPGQAPLSVRHAPERPAQGNIPVQVWRDQCLADCVEPEVDQALSDFLGQSCRLVRLPKSSVRSVDPNYAQPEDQVGFADGFPLLLISQASLDDLNQRLESPISMERFRPNLVVSGCEPFAEDQWRRIRIGGIEFRVVKPCSRCSIPGVDPDTGERSKEPTRTLATYRQRDHQVYFGQNLLHDSTGQLEVGMPVEVLA